MVVSRPLSRLGRLLCGVAAAATALTPVAASAQQAKGLQLIRDTEIEETLHLECDPVFAAAGLNPKNTTILIQQDEFNAATANGQTLLIGTKIIEETENPNQLIGVMAHETGHAAGGHTARRGELERAGLGPMIISAGLGLLALAVAPEAGLALLTSAPMFGTLGALGFSREQEGRADQAAATYLELAGESGRGLVEFFDKFRYEEVFSEARRYAFFNDHPISGDRIELLRRRVEAQKHYAAVDGADLIARHETMKAKLKAFIGSPAQTFQLYPETDKSFNGRYARAGENCRGRTSTWPEVIRPWDRPLAERAGFLVLRGNLFDSAVMKTSVIGPEFSERYLSDPADPDAFQGPVVVFDGPEDYHARIDDPAAGITEHTILVMRGTGPIGYPGSAEVVNMRPPAALIKAGVHALPCIGDGRQSGTSASPSILNASPEAAAGGGLALLRTGDRVRVDLGRARCDVLLDEAELAGRRTALEAAGGYPYPPSQTPWQEMQRAVVGQLGEGMVLEPAVKFQRVDATSGVPRDSH